MERSKHQRILFTWLLIVIILSGVTSTLSAIIWTYFLGGDIYSVGYRPVDTIVSLLTLMPLGWLIALLTPAGWLNALGLALAIRKRTKKPLVISAAGAILFGAFWPYLFLSMMSV